MTKLKTEYRSVQAPPGLAHRVLDDFTRTGLARTYLWPAPAAALMVLVIAGALVSQQPAPPAAGVGMSASIPPTVSAMRLAGMTTDIGGLSRLTASDLRLPTREVTTAIPSMPRMPRVPNS